MNSIYDAKSASKQQRIVIVGGGMVGVSLALLLSRAFSVKRSGSQASAQVSITLVEQCPFPAENQHPQYQLSFDERSTAISAGSVEILKAMECWSRLLAQAEPIKQVHVSDRGYLGGVRLQANEYKLDALGYVVQNRWLGQVLLQQLRQTQVECLASARVSECKPRADGYRLTLEQNNPDEQEKHKREVHADLLMIADGAESTLRQSLGIATEEKDYHQVAMVANVALDRPHQGIAYERFTDEGPIALLPLSDFPLNNNVNCHDSHHRASLVWTLPTSQEPSVFSAFKREPLAVKIKAMPEPELLDYLQQRFGYRAGNIKTIGERHCYPLKLMKAQEQVRSNLVVIGNAAHFLHPVAGQGFNLALRDCFNLVECLHQSQTNNKYKQLPVGHLRVLQAYLEKQIQDQQLTIGVTDRLIQLFSTQRLPSVIFRQLGLLSLNALPPPRHQLAKLMMGVR